MAEAFASTSLNLEKFGAGMANVGAIAKTTGRSLEFTSAALGTLVDRNIDASKAGTDLRKIFIELANQGLTFEEAMTQIRGATDKVTTAVTLFGVRSAASAIILSDNEEKVNELAMAYGDLNTELDSMVSIVEDNLNTDLALLASAFDGLIQKGSAFNTGFRASTKVLTEFLKGNFTLSQILDDAAEAVIKQEQAAHRLRVTQEKVNSAFASNNVQAYLDRLVLVGKSEDAVAQIRERLAKEEKERQAEQLRALGKQIKAQEELNRVNKFAGIQEVQRKEAAPLLPPDVLPDSFELPGVEGLQEKIAEAREGFNTESQGFLDDLTGWNENIQLVIEGASSALSAGFQAIGAAIASGQDPIKAAGQAILSVFGSIMSQLGASMIASGVAMLAAQVAISNPFTSGLGLIAAGAALSILGGAIGAFASGASGGVSGGGASSGGSGSVRARDSGTVGLMGAGVNNQEFTFNIVGEIRGQDLIFIQEKANRDRGIRG